MFLLNLGYDWSHSSLSNLSGAILLPAGNSAARVSRRAPSELKALLFDPQLYLAGLAVDKRTKVCARLAGYAWFQVPETDDFNSEVMGQKEWDKKLLEVVEENWPGEPPTEEEDIERACEAAVSFQQNLGVTSIILPCPLLEEREDEGETLGIWIDAGLRAAEQEEDEAVVPLLATIAVSENALSDRAFATGGLLDAIVDQVSARVDEGISGAYVVVAQTGTPTNAFEAHQRVTRAYFELVTRLVEAGVSRVITNFADLAGLASLGLGATSFASGATTSLRALQLEGFKDKGGGLALPHYYSHRTSTEYRSESDLIHVVRNKLVRRVADVTEASASLVAAMRKGNTGQAVPTWAESQNNTSAAKQHYVECLIREGQRMRKTPPDERLEKVLDWLETAEGNALLVDRRSKQNKQVGRRPDLEGWRELLEG